MTASVQSDEGHEPMVDLTERLTLHSKRTERAQKRQQRRVEKTKVQSHVSNILDLPYEIVLEILSYCQPSTIFSLCGVNRAYRGFIQMEETRIADSICDLRYGCLRRCFHTPVLLEDVNPDAHAALKSTDRVELKNALKKPYQHVQAPDPDLICTCFICLFRWTALNIILDFAHWQDNLDHGEPIPVIQRGRNPEWNRKLLAEHAWIVRKALRSPLSHALLLERHLQSTTRAIRRHAANKGNKRRRFRMTLEDVESGTDRFLERSGPPTLDLPFMRDNYYMLEAFLPNRGWSGDQERWMYQPQSQHDTDLRIAVTWAKWRADRAAAQAASIPATGEGGR